MRLDHLTDKQLLIEITRLATLERQTTTELLHHIREMEKRRLFCELGHSSMFDYLVKGLRFSEGQAYRRINAARLLEKKPHLEDKIKSGELNVTVLSDIQSFIRQEKPDELKQDDIIQKAGGLTRKETETMLIRESSKKIPHKDEKLKRESSEHHRLSVNLSNETLAMLQKIRDLWGHKKIESHEDLIAMLAQFTLSKIDPIMKTEGSRKKTKASNQDLRNVTGTGNSKKAKQSRYIPAKMKKAVWKRDGGVCSKCGSTHALEYDHRIPYAIGGANDHDNLRLLCRQCNQRQRDEFFGQTRTVNNQ